MIHSARAPTSKYNVRSTHFILVHFSFSRCIYPKWQLRKQANPFLDQMAKLWHHSQLQDVVLCRWGTPPSTSLKPMSNYFTKIFLQDSVWVMIRVKNFGMNILIRSVEYFNLCIYILNNYKLSMITLLSSRWQKNNYFSCQSNTQDIIIICR